MNYENLKNIARTRGLVIDKMLTIVDMTKAGFKFAVEHETLQSGKLKKLCDFLGITPNEWYGIEGREQNALAHHISGGSVTQFSQMTSSQEEIDFLRKQIEIKDTQIAEILRLANK